MLVDRDRYSDPVTDSPRRRRPLPVTVAVVLVTIGALLSVTTGVLVLLSRYQVPADAVLPVSLLGSATALLGLLTLALAAGIARGSRLARVLVTILVALEIATHVLTIVTTDGWDVTSLIDLAVAAIVLLAVWVPPGARHFRRERTPEGPAAG